MPVDGWNYKDKHWRRFVIFLVYSVHVVEFILKVLIFDYFPGIMASTAPRWDKLSPTEFQQLQDLASCE